MLIWIFWKIPSPCYISFHEPCQVAWGHATNSVEGGRTIFTTYSLPWFHFFTTLHIHFHDSISSPLSLHFFHLPFTNIYFPMILCCTLLHTQYWHASLILQKGFLVHIMISNECLHYYWRKREQKMKWMLLTQEPTFFVFMVVTQEPTIRKCKLLLMSFTYPRNIHY